MHALEKKQTLVFLIHAHFAVTTVLIVMYLVIILTSILSSTLLLPEVTINYRVVQKKHVKMKASYSCTLVVTQ